MDTSSRLPSSLARDALRTPQPLLTIAIAAALAVIFIAGHVPLVRETLDGIDSTNFMLAIDGYNPRLHQPHPPGFPVHVALGRVVTSAYRALMAGEHEIGTVAAGLRIWSVICGALTTMAMMWLALQIGLTAWRAAVATALVTLCPLFWITAMRPLSDVPGLLFATIAQALALSAFNHTVTSRSDTGRPRRSTLRGTDWRWLAAAFAAGLAIGVRLQTSLLTLPLLGVLVTLHVRHAGIRFLPPLIASFAIGLLIWAVPLALTLGGPAEYFRLLRTVAADDVLGVEMLSTQFSPRLLLAALMRTFIVPWGSVGLGVVVGCLAIAGAVSHALWKHRVAAGLLVLGAPYLLFHLLFQETASIRYALPLVPVAAMMIVGTLRFRATWVAAPLVMTLAAFATAASVNAATAYSRTESPVARALEDVTREAGRRSHPPALASHHSVGRAIRAEHWPGSMIASPVRYEWLELARRWRDGSRDTVWFLADGRRTDLALIDPAARRLMQSYQWPDETEALLGGIQPPRVSWYELSPPGWFLMTGWALTPETRGVSTRDQHGPGSDGALGYIRRRQGPATMLIGGRNLGGPCDTAARVEVLIDGKPRASWTVPSRSSFLEKIVLPAGALSGDGGFAEVNVVAGDVTLAGQLVDVAIEQFDVQSADAVMTAFDRGWHMPELDATTGVGWRWMENDADITVESFGRNVRLAIRGESPLRYFQEPPRVIVTAGDVELGTFRPNEDFDWNLAISAATLASANGQITVRSDREFIPDEVNGNGDRRRLALRIFSVSASPLP
jgi:hypothetical protein